LGSSKPWPEAIRTLTKGRMTRMDAAPIMEYFQPLMVWLREQNAEEKAGWSMNFIIKSYIMLMTHFQFYYYYFVYIVLSGGMNSGTPLAHSWTMAVLPLLVSVVRRWV